MIKFISRLFIPLFSIILISCEKNIEQTNLIITSGTACGWCAGTDSVTITQAKTIYKFNSPCDDNDLNITRTTDSKVWNRLIDNLEISSFNAINLNSCNVCADGCDTWISVNNEGKYHRIRYGYDDSDAIDKIRPFAEQLDSIRNSFRER